MLGLRRTGKVRASAAAGLARSQDIYQRYAATLYWEALLTVDDSASPEYVVRDAIVNECALAVIPGRGGDDSRYRLAESVFRRCRRGRGPKRAQGAAAQGAAG